ncbi:MAG: 50S ribosomal protein L32 [Pseudomonadota bacterium]
MPVPQRKKSKSRSGMRQAHDFLKIKSPSHCANPACGEPIKPHVVCPSCGQYKGKLVLQVEK